MNGGGHDNEHMLKAPTSPKSRGKHDEFRNTLFWLRDDIKFFTEIGKLKSVARIYRTIAKLKETLEVLTKRHGYVVARAILSHALEERRG
jgi:hypothetical protein